MWSKFVLNKFFKNVFKVLEITLDESDVFSAWVSARDAGFADKPSDAKGFFVKIFKKYFKNFYLSQFWWFVVEKSF